MLPDRVSNPGPLTYESDALPIALRGPAPSIKVTICSIYLPPDDILSKNSLVSLIDQLPHPFILVGDIDGHSKVWGCADTNDRGEIVEDVIAENDLCLLNEK